MSVNVSLSRQFLYGFICVFFVIFAVYGRVIGFEFVWDDTSVIWDSGSYHGEGFFNAIWSNFPISENYFRPFVVVTFALDKLLCDNSPGLMHLHNLLVHISSSMLVGLLTAQFLFRLGKLDSLLFPVLAALIFGLHPMVIEPASWISGRFDAYVTFWLLLLANVDLVVQRLSFRIVSAFLLFLLAALSKEMAAVFPAMYFLVRMAYLPEQGILSSRFQALRADGSLAICGVLVLAGCVYLLLRFSALGYLQQPFDPGIVRAHFGEPMQHALLVGKTAGTYIMYAVAGGAFTSPVHFQSFPVPYDDLGAWSGTIATGVLLIGSLLLLRTGDRLGYIVPVFLTGMLPVLNILFWPNTEDIVQERFMSLPLAIATVLVVVELAVVSVKKKKFVLFPLVCFLLVNGAITSVTMPVWSNHMSLWSWAVYRAPQSTYAATNLAVSFRIVGDRKNARRYAEIANRLDPLLRMGDFTLASIAVDEKKYTEAIRIADEYVKREGITEVQRGDLLYIKATALHELGSEEAAISILQDLVKASGHNWRSALLLGAALEKAGQEYRAYACWAVALKEMPASEASKRFSDGQLHVEDIERKANGQACVR
ncbi:MAG TPA: hypothetical protein PLF22_00225 [Pseudomonadales bacterium]|nr:hypothetical protein [Pseudomonadales bacterium]